MSGSTPETQPTTPLQAALEYAALGWPVIPGAVWHDGRFADPADEQPVTSPFLRPIDAATTDPALVREWWSAPGLHAPNVLTMTGPGLGAVSVYESLVDAIVDHRWFSTRPTPVLAIPGMPLAYFLVRPPIPITLPSDEARVLAEGTTLPLPPSTIGSRSATWLVSPEQAGNVLLIGDELADLIRSLSRKSA
ncbi:bifunctional DNA primase/polymerase [Saccharothrix deserti]|uniref:bifunctional DNA primase/polymerase n=1 Tax=Saccharothrix deserti TaxID=2593674 RepID=UPI00131C8651|nr:bifunctional DNA primase/polymerase [Saccharothrix deserti]